MKSRQLLFLSIASIAILGLFSNCNSNDGYRHNVDKYIELETQAAIDDAALNQGISVYVDFSDGMNAAYGSRIAQDALKKLINVFTGASEQADFYSLADGKISPLELKQTEIYNAIMSPANYKKAMAPIEETVKQITDKRQAALLITDFEEYNGGIIQQQNYAKDYFIKWLEDGYNITFYKIDYKEGAKDKHLYFAIFDYAMNALGARVEIAIHEYIGNGIDKFVLASPKASFGLATAYLSASKGATYHNSEGEDIVTAVIEKGDDESYITYTKADENGDYKNLYTSRKPGYGPLKAYYPLGVPWEGIISNSKSMQEEGIAPEDKFKHLFSNTFVNFSIQDGYTINSVVAKLYNCEATMNAFIEAQNREMSEDEEEGKPADTNKQMPKPHEIMDMMTATLTPVQTADLPGTGWYEITADFDSRFSGRIPASMKTPEDLLRLDIVIGEAVPRLEVVQEFFAWPGNNSLAESVRNTLQNEKINPKGQPVVTFYIKVL